MVSVEAPDRPKCLVQETRHKKALRDFYPACHQHVLTNMFFLILFIFILRHFLKQHKFYRSLNYNSIFNSVSFFIPFSLKVDVMLGSEKSFFPRRGFELTAQSTVYRCSR